MNALPVREKVTLATASRYKIIGVTCGVCGCVCMCVCVLLSDCVCVCMYVCV